LSIALWAKVEQMEKRIQALENASAPSPSGPPRNNAARQAEGGRLRIAIEGILAAHPNYTAKYVLKALAAIDLGRQSLPSVRTVQWHLKTLRNTTRIARGDQSAGIALR
jgi:hypothetical protein